MITEKVISTRRLTDLKAYRHQATKAAKDLRYGQDVIDRIKEAKSEYEIDRIMKDARHNFLKDNWERG